MGKPKVAAPESLYVTEQPYTAEHGEPFKRGGKKDISNGPVSKRGCTDCLFLILFIVFWGGMAYVASLGLKNGDPDRLTHMYDSNGKGCGLEAPYGYGSAFPVLYWPNPLELNEAVCVDACPSAYGAAYSCATTYSFSGCVLPGYESTTAFGRLCLPFGSASANAANITEGIGGQQLQNWIGDLKTAWAIVPIIAGIALLIGLIFMLLLKYFAGFIVWCCILGTIGFTAAVGYLCKRRVDQIDNNEIVSTDQNRQSLFYLSYIFYGLAGLLVLITLCMYSRIRLAIAIMKCAAQFVRDVWTVLFVPFFIFLITAGFYAYWVYMALYIFSSGTVETGSGSPFATVKLDERLEYAFLYHIFGLFWTNAFLVALNYIIIAGAASIWYFSPYEGDRKVPQGAVRKSIYRAFRYHLGSLAFGSLLIATVQFVRFILSYMKSKLKATGKEPSKPVKIVLCMVDCCLACFERFLKFISKNAYIQIALTGHKFCRAAKDAFMLILRNALRFAAVDKIGDMFLFLGRLVISLGAAGAGYAGLVHYKYYKENLTSPIFPAVVGFAVAWVIGSSFMSVYGMAADTILQCFAADEEMNKKKRGGAEHAPPVLRDFLDMYGGDEKKGCCRS